MATTYSAINYSVPMPGIANAGAVVTREFAFLVAVALAAADIIKLAPIPQVAGAGLVIDEYYIDVPDLDTDATPAITLNLGDATTAAKFVSAATTGQAGGKITPAVNGVSGAIPVVYTAASDFRLTVGTAPDVGATDVTIKGWMRYHFVGASTPL